MQGPRCRGIPVSECSFKLALESAEDKRACADKFSQLAVGMAIQVVEGIVGATKPSHRKGKFRSKEVAKATAEITTLQKARDLIRTLCLNEWNSVEEKLEIHSHLEF